MPVFPDTPTPQQELHFMAYIDLPIAPELGREFLASADP